MAVENRIPLIKQIEEARSSKLISYIGSTRDGADYPMRQFHIRTVESHLLKIGKTSKIDLLLHSYGGDITFPWRLVNLIREYSDEFNVIVPLHAFSAGTLTALGADSIVMLPAACLGPTDPQSNSPFNPRDHRNNKNIPINTEDITNFFKFIKEDLELSTQADLLEALKLLAQSDNRIHPIALGQAKRGSKLAEKYAKELLITHKKKKIKSTTITNIVKKFGSELYAHDHPINRQEAKQLSLNIVTESVSTEKLIWDLYQDYEKELELNNPYNPIYEFKKLQPTLPFVPGSPPTPVQLTIPKKKLLIIESTHITNTFFEEIEVTGIKFFNNNQINENYAWIINNSGYDEIIR